MREPDAINFFRKNDFGNCKKGIISGLLTLAVAILNLSLFFGYFLHSENEVFYINRSNLSNFYL
jgi:hypothetical protein